LPLKPERTGYSAHPRKRAGRSLKSTENKPERVHQHHGRFETNTNRFMRGFWTFELKILSRCSFEIFKSGQRET